MIPFARASTAAVLIAAATFLPSCDAAGPSSPPPGRGGASGSVPRAPADDGHDHGHGAGGGHGHVHVAPHGGTLVILGDEAAHVEVLVDAATGGISAWILDSHADRARRVTHRTLEITGTARGAPFTVVLDAVANPLTGETVGDSSEFRGISEALRGAPPFRGRLPAITVSGMAFPPTEFEYPGAGSGK